jgi:serine protease AprX
MDRNAFILFSAASVLLLAVAGAQIAEAGSSDAVGKIDTDLAEMLDGAGEERIPVIVMLKGTEAPDFGGFDVKYSYQLIPGLAGEASSTTIRDMAQRDRVSAIYFDDPAKISAPGEDIASAPDNALVYDNSSVDGQDNDSDSPSDGYVSPARIIKADKLWEMGIDGRGVNVAVIDSGIDKNHPDLIGKVIAEKNFLANEITADDLLGHGTMIAGIIAGSGASSGGRYVGIAPGASLINVKVIDQNGDGRVSDIIAGIEWAIYNGADVLSLSLGGINLGETNPPITMAADNAADQGVVVCVAAGNRNSTENENQLSGASSSQLRGSPVELSQTEESSGKDVYFLFVPIVFALPPGLIDSPGDGVNVITLGSTDAAGHMASFSGSGPTRDDRIKPDVVAPGMDIISTVPAGLEGPKYVDTYYARESGTSLSTPIAAGLAALLLQERSNLTPAGIKGAMTRGAAKLNNTHGVAYESYYQGTGLLDALHSYQLLEELGDGMSGVVPDLWKPGRWAYLPSGEGVYVGLDTGADRPQKKVYALAPGDRDWNTRFVFFSNRERDGISLSAQGEIADWVSLQALPEHISSNSQHVFAASIQVPEDTDPGDYSGSLDITDSGETVLEIPVSLTVAEPLSISQGMGGNSGSLTENQWDYYYLDLPVGSRGIEVRLDWNSKSDSVDADRTDSNSTASSSTDLGSSLDLFLISPTSEYYAGGPEGSSKRVAIDSPPSGRWLVAVYSENASVNASYTLKVEQEMIEPTPKRWHIDSANPGMNASIEILLENKGQTMENLSYAAVIENESLVEYEDRVGLKQIWNQTVNVTDETIRLSAELATISGSRYSEVALVLEDPDGMASEEHADLGSGYLGPVEVSNPQAGRWVVNVYGYNVPETGQPFRLTVKQYKEEPWSWISISGPDRLEAGSNKTLRASLALPQIPAQHQLQGYIKIWANDSSIQIPVSISLAGSRLVGLSSEEVLDEDEDGKHDQLVLGFGVNVTITGNFRLNGVVNDCHGNRIDVIDQSMRLDEDGDIHVNVSGTDIWRAAKCGPIRIENLVLYDNTGNYLDRYEEDIRIDRDPKEFQAPAAYISGFVNQTTAEVIAVGVNLSVTKPGTYRIDGFILDDSGEEIGYEKVEERLNPGNHTLSLEFSPSDFIIQEEVSRVRLVDLVLTSDGEELENRDLAWTSEEMDPLAFRAVPGSGEAMASQESVVPAGSDSDLPFPAAEGAVLRRENGTVVIS